jgi:hypothetical protein
MCRESGKPQFLNTGLSTILKQAASMTTIVLVGVAISLALFAILTKFRDRKPKRADKWEKAQIVKRLVALSEHEDTVRGISRQQAVSKSPTPRRQATAQQGTLTR